MKERKKWHCNKNNTNDSTIAIYMVNFIIVSCHAASNTFKIYCIVICSKEKCTINDNLFREKLSQNNSNRKGKKRREERRKKKGRKKKQ